MVTFTMGVVAPTVSHRFLQALLMLAMLLTGVSGTESPSSSEWPEHVSSDQSVV